MKGFNYPPPTGPYKVDIKKAAPWRNYKTCRLQVSVGKPNFEGDKFFATCEWAANRFDHVTVIVSDTLQRHNVRYELGCGPAACWKITRMQGDLWLQRNAQALALLGDATILRWDELLSDPDYKSLTAHGIEDELEIALQDFWRRRGGEGEIDPAFRECSSAFLLEEFAVFDLLFEKPAIDVYAGTWFRSLMERKYPQKDYMSVDFTRNRAAA